MDSPTVSQQSLEIRQSLLLLVGSSGWRVERGSGEDVESGEGRSMVWWDGEWGGSVVWWGMESGEEHGGVGGWGERTWCGGEEVWVGREHGVAGAWGGNVVWWRHDPDAAIQHFHHPGTGA